MVKDIQAKATKIEIQTESRKKLPLDILIFPKSKIIETTEEWKI